MQPRVSDWVCARLWFMSTGYPRLFSAGKANVISLECCEPPFRACALLQHPHGTGSCLLAPATGLVFLSESTSMSVQAAALMKDYEYLLVLDHSGSSPELLRCFASLSGLGREEIVPLITGGEVGCDSVPGNAYPQEHCNGQPCHICVFVLHRSHMHYFESRPRSLAQVSCQVSGLQLLGAAQGWGILGI